VVGECGRPCTAAEGQALVALGLVEEVMAAVPYWAVAAYGLTPLGTQVARRVVAQTDARLALWGGGS